MHRLLFLICLMVATTAHAQTTRLQLSASDFQLTSTFSDIDVFEFDIVINAEPAPGVYDNPELVSVTYRVMGTLAAGTPSGFPAFDLQRDITGDEFYAQGSSLRFEVAQNAVLTDGIQVAELAGSDVVFTFNGREVDNGRFHPALFELRADGTGRLQNSNNVPTLNPLNEVAFGAEYITDVMFDAGNLTLVAAPPTPPTLTVDSGGGAAGWAIIITLGCLALHRRRS